MPRFEDKEDSLEIKDFFICDDVRKEEGGKFSFMGVFGPKVIVPRLPFIFPKIVFVLKLTGGDGKVSGTVTFEQPGGKLLLPQKPFDLEVPQGRLMLMGFWFFTAQNLKFEKAGKHKFLLEWQLEGASPRSFEEEIEIEIAKPNTQH